MRTLFLTFTLISIYSSLSAQLVARLDLKENIPGICNKNEVYALLPMLDKNQIDAVCPVSDSTITNRLNIEVKYVKENLKLKCKGMVGLIINCEGKVVQCKIDNSTGIVELDNQILKVFESLGNWKNGSYYGKAVDCSKLYSYKIKKGKIYLN